MSHEAKGLSPLAGGLGVPDAWCTAVAAYGPADAPASGRRTISPEATISAEATPAARGMPFLMTHLHRTEPKLSLVAGAATAAGFTAASEPCRGRRWSP